MKVGSMKIRSGFVSNSSSSSFHITNKTDEVKTLVDFVRENIWMLKSYLNHYGAFGFKSLTEEEFVTGAIDFADMEPGKTATYSFSNEVGNPTETVLRTELDGEVHESPSFKWELLYNSQTDDWYYDELEKTGS